MCQKSKIPVWFKPDTNIDEQFMVRMGPSSQKLAPINAFDYIKNHFK